MTDAERWEFDSRMPHVHHYGWFYITAQHRYLRIWAIGRENVPVPDFSKISEWAIFVWSLKKFFCFSLILRFWKTGYWDIFSADGSFAWMWKLKLKLKETFLLLLDGCEEEYSSFSWHTCKYGIFFISQETIPVLLVHSLLRRVAEQGLTQAYTTSAEQATRRS